jgi:hypothetical protein
MVGGGLYYVLLCRHIAYTRADDDLAHGLVEESEGDRG